MKLADGFESFLRAIRLDEAARGVIDSAWYDLQRFLMKELHLAYQQVFLHGSYANGVARRAHVPTAECDVDIVVVCSAAAWDSKEAYDRLEQVLRTNPEYEDGLERRRRCIRLRVSGKTNPRFHFDLVPARLEDPPVLSVPLGNEGWITTNPVGYNQWFRTRSDQFKRTVCALKWWRDLDVEGTRGVSSVVCEVLVGTSLPPAAVSDAEAVATVFQRIDERLADHPHRPPGIPNPSLPTADLTDEWPPKDYRRFREEVAAARHLAGRALAESDLLESHRLWIELFGPEFPGAPAV